MNTKSQKFQRRAYRVRAKLRNVSERSRLSVFKSGRHIYAQIIDDSTATTIVSASSLDKEIRQENKSNCNIESAVKVGKLLAQRAVAKKVTLVAFDKGGNKYHGVVKALADEARKELKF